MVDYGRQLTKHTYEYRLSVIGKAVHETYAENQTPSKMKKTHKLWSAHAWLNNGGLSAEFDNCDEQRPELIGADGEQKCEQWG